MKKTERILMMIFFIILLSCGYYLLDYCRESYGNRKSYEAVEDIAFPSGGNDNQDSKECGKEENASIDFKALLSKNADCIGWLNIPGTDINYPVVQGSDNSYYLTHDFYKNYASCGSLFLDYRNDADAEREHLIIYGHQMKDGSMFKALTGYKSESFYKEHKNLTLYLGENGYSYEIAAVYVTNVEKSGDYYNYLHGDTRQEQMEYLKKMAAYSLYDTGVTVTESDELLSLSTCEYSSKNGRLIVLARRVKGGE
jgi:sortase B